MSCWCKDTLIQKKQELILNRSGVKTNSGYRRRLQTKSLELTQFIKKKKKNRMIVVNFSFHKVIGTKLKKVEKLRITQTII